MLTILGWFVNDIKDIRYSIYVEYCAAHAKHYCKIKDKEKAMYWSNAMSKYLLKRFELHHKKRA